MNFYPFLILLLAFGARAYEPTEVVTPPIDLQCFNNDLRYASLDINDQGVRFQNRFLLEGNSELERYYQENLELKTTSDLTINKVQFAIPAGDVKCTRFSPGTFTCRGFSRSAILDVSGNYTKNNTLVALNGQTQVQARIIALNTKLVPDLTSDLKVNNLQLEARVEITFLDGRTMTLAWSAYFAALGDVTHPSYCKGL